MNCEKIILGGESIKYLDQNSVNRLLDYAIEHGIKYIDTAPAYESSESLIGSNRNRNDFKISTKVGIPGGQLTSSKIVASVDKSLSSLRIEQIDCIFLHSVDPNLVTNEVLDELESLVKAGKISKYGYSGDGKFLKLATTNSKILSNFMCTFNIVDQGNYNTIVSNPDFNWTIKRALANGIWHYNFFKRMLSVRQLLLGIENSHKTDVYWNRFNLLKEIGGIDKITLPMLIGYIERKLPLAKIIVGTRSPKHLSQLLKNNSISDGDFDLISNSWEIMSRKELEVRV